MPSPFSASNRRSSLTAISGSTFPVGSSATSISGRPMIARAIATRCCSPPESVAGRACIRSASPTHSSMSATGRASSRSAIPATRSGSATLSKAERCGTSRKSWNTTPIRRRSPGRSLRRMVMTSDPNMRIIPREGRCAR